MSIFDRQVLSRRRFLSVAGLGAGAALAGPYLAGCGSGSSGANGRLSIMAWSHTVPAYDVAFDEFAQQWGRDNGVAVRVDHVAINDIPARLGAEITSKSGHDIVQMPPATGVSSVPDQLVDLTDLVAELGDEYGGWNQLAEQGATVEGRWLAYPDYGGHKPGFYRKDLFDARGLPAPDTWEGLLAAGRALKPEGHPLALTLGHTGDSNQFWMSLLWCYGAYFANADGRFAGLDSPQLREALDVASGIYRDGCTKDVLSWDDAGNNNALIAGTASCTINGLSILGAVEKANPDVARNIALAMPPGGPATRAILTNQFMLGIWNFSKSVDVAKQFLRAYRGEWKRFAEVSGGTNIKLFKNIPRPYPILDDDPRTAGLVDQVPFLSAVGYPGPATSAANEVANNYLVSRVVQGESAATVVPEVERKIVDIYRTAGLLS